jgi:hypothetical protein
VSWFKPLRNQEVTRGSDREWALPFPSVSQIRIDESGRLWVIAAVPNDRWGGRAVERAQRAEAKESDEILRQIVDLHIEVFDPKTKRLLASRKFANDVDTLETWVPRTSFALRRRDDASSGPQMEMFRITLRDSAGDLCGGR